MFKDKGFMCVCLMALILCALILHCGTYVHLEESRETSAPAINPEDGKKIKLKVTGVEDVQESVKHDKLPPWFFPEMKVEYKNSIYNCMHRVALIKHYTYLKNRIYKQGCPYCGSYLTFHPQTPRIWHLECKDKDCNGVCQEKLEGAKYQERQEPVAVPEPEPWPTEGWKKFK